MELNKKVDQLLQELKSGKFNKVILEGKKLLKKYPDKEYLQNICGLAHQRLNNIKTSIFYFKKAIELDPSNPGQKNNLANSYIYLNEYDKAERIFNEILEKNPNYTAAIVNYARLKNILLDFKNSIILYEKATKLIKNDLGIWLNLASVYQNSGNFEKANELYNNILNFNPNYVPAHTSISKINNYNEDASNLKQMLELNRKTKLNKREKSDLEFAIGKAYDDQKNFELSIKYFESANKNRKELIDYNFKDEEKTFKSIIKYFEKLDFKKINKTKSKKKNNIYSWITKIRNNPDRTNFICP